MGCNCGGAGTKKHYLVTMRNGGNRMLFSSEMDARIAITKHGGGEWVEVDKDRYQELVGEGIPVG